MLNHATNVGSDGRGDIPPGWYISKIWGPGSPSPGYFPKFPPCTGLALGWPFTKQNELISGLTLLFVFALFWHLGYTDPGRFGWRGAEG